MNAKREEAYYTKWDRLNGALNTAKKNMIANPMNNDLSEKFVIAGNALAKHENSF